MALTSLSRQFQAKKKTYNMDAKNSPNYIEGLAEEAKKYADLKVDELKLKATKGLSIALSQLLAYLLIIAVLSIVLGLLSYALLQWLNVLVGAPWGTFIVCGLFAIVLVVLLILRKKLFRNLFVKLFIDIFYDRGENE